MQVTGLDGRTYNWNLSKNRVAANDTRPRSAGHLVARALLKRLYPASSILEEVALPGTNQLKLDFLLPQLNLAIEVHGEQHYNRVPFFQSSVKVFMAGKYRDSLKLSWCELNNITLLVLKHDEQDEWETSIRNR